VLQPAPFTPTPKAAKRVLEFFTARINIDHTGKALVSLGKTWLKRPARELKR